VTDSEKRKMRRARMFDLIFSHILTLISGIVLGVTVTCCCVISGRADKQLGIKDKEE
jgi:hypothetical protein